MWKDVFWKGGGEGKRITGYEKECLKERQKALFDKKGKEPKTGMYFSHAGYTGKRKGVSRMKHIKSSMLVIFLSLMILTMMAVYVPSARAGENPGHEIVRVPIFSTPMGSGLYEWWGIYERIFEKYHPWLRPIVQESPGFIYNLKMMANKKERWKEVIFAVNMPVMAAAEHAIKPFFDEPISGKPWKLLYPSNGCATSAFFWVTLDPEIKNMMDFDGKRLGVGLKGQINFGLWPTVAVETLGINAKLEYLGGAKAIDALLDGRVSAAQALVYYPHAQPPGKKLEAHPLATLQRVIASRREFYYVSYGPEWIDRMKQQKGYTLASTLKIEPGTLPKQTKELIAAGVEPSGWTVHETFPDEVAYEFTKFLIIHGNKLAKYTKIGEYFVIPEGTLSMKGFTEENTHPGAIRAFKEAGVWN